MDDEALLPKNPHDGCADAIVNRVRKYVDNGNPVRCGEMLT